MKKEIFFDLETQRWSTEVEGGWNNIHGFGLSIAVSWDKGYGFRDWPESKVQELIKELAQFDTIIGFNLLKFDYEVLSGYVDDVHMLLNGKTFDIFIDVKERLSPDMKWPSLEEISSPTLGIEKLGTGYEAVSWFQEGKIKEVIDYCRQDVELTREIYEYGREHGLIYYCPTRGVRIEVKVDWK